MPRLLVPVGTPEIGEHTRAIAALCRRLTALGATGIVRLHVNGAIVDDLPENRRLLTEQRFRFEELDPAAIGPGDRVRYREILDPGDDLCTFDVIEDRDDRILMALVCDMTIRPMTVALKTDLVKIDPPAS